MQSSKAHPPKAGIVAVLLDCHELHSIVALRGYAGEDMICPSSRASERCRDQLGKHTNRWCHTQNKHTLAAWRNSHL